MSVRELRADLADVINAASTRGQVTFVTSRGRRVAGVVSVAAAEQVAAVGDQADGDAGTAVMFAVNLAMMLDRGGTPSLTPAECFEQYASDLVREFGGSAERALAAARAVIAGSAGKSGYPTLWMQAALAVELADWAEDYAAEVWRRHFPDSAEPPVWITLQLSPGSRGGRRPQRFSLVTFRLWEPYELSWPQRFAMTDADVAALAGAPVDRDRGDGYQPWPVEPDPEPVWRVAWTILLPRPEGMDRGCITAAAPWWRRLARQVIPLRTTRDCCYYHRVNWRQVSAVAIRVTRQARREGLVGEAIGDRVAVLAATQGLPARQEEALADLLADHSALQPARVSASARDTPTDGTARPRCSTSASAGPSSSAGDTPAEGRKLR